MKKTIKLTVALMLVLPALSGAEKPASAFFEFSEVRRPSETMLTRIHEHPGAALAFQTTETFIQVDGQAAVQYELHDGAYVAKTLPELPVQLSSAGIAVAENILYAAGLQRGSETNAVFMQLNLAGPETGWIVCPAPLQQLSGPPVLVSSHGTLYVAGLGADGKDAFAYNPQRGVWTALESAPENLRGFKAVPCGDAHLLFFDTAHSSDRILAYHRITGTWFDAGSLPQAVAVLGAVPSGVEFTILSETVSIHGKALLKATKYGVYDHLVVALLLVALVGVGIFFSNKEKSSGDYFRAGKRIPWWAAGLSLFASGASAISLMAMPGKAYASNWIYFSISLYTVAVGLPLMLLVYIPIARRLNISTANDYLERRFSLPVRMLGFVIYSLNQMLGRMAAVLLLPAIAISSIFGLPMTHSILIMGVVSTVYVTLGGLEAVIWTDVLQAVVMLLAVFVCAVWAGLSLHMTVPDAMQIVSGMNKLQVFDFSFDWTAPVFIVLFANIISLSLGMIGDQTFIQRVQCTRNEKESRKAVITQLAVAVPMNIVLFTLGTLLFLFYRSRPETLSPALKSDGIFPFFAAQNLPPGMAGFVVAALLAATMSTVSGAINSVANLGVEDVYRRFFPKATDHRCLILGKVLTISLGVFGTGAALILAKTSLLSVWDLALMITGMILAPISGIFVLGIFTRRANSFGAWIGMAASIAANIYADRCLNLHPLAFLTVGVFTCIIAGYLASFLLPKSTRELDGLTVFTLLKSKTKPGLSDMEKEL